MHSPTKSVRSLIFYQGFWLQIASMPPKPEMGLGEEVEMSGQWRVAAVPFWMVLGMR